MLSAWTPREQAPATPKLNSAKLAEKNVHLQHVPSVSFVLTNKTVSTSRTDAKQLPFNNKPKKKCRQSADFQHPYFFPASKAVTVEYRWHTDDSPEG